LNKELELVKQSENQNINYKNKDPPKEMKNLEEIVENVENGRNRKEGRKKESCQCACHIY
jgi:hypothetical protein